MSDYSKNDKAEQIVGKRPTGYVSINSPIEQGYVCPICKTKYIKKTEKYSLDWSEYNAFLYCYNCNIDIPSCFCVPHMFSRGGMEIAINIFLETIKDIKGDSLNFYKGR